MNQFLQTGVKIVFLALASYSIGIISGQRKKRLTGNLLWFLTLGVILDITATTFMILGSSKGAFTLHGVIGYSSLLGMAVDAVLVWRLKMKSGKDAPVSKGLHLYSRYAYIWWIAAFITGALLVMLGR